jgi:DNA-binding LacI/PurR family transcriptional regulator
MEVTPAGLVPTHAEKERPRCVDSKLQPACRLAGPVAGPASAGGGMVAAVSDRPARNGGRHAVVYDVARLAGVSHTTVSRVINGSEQVRPETRERVLQAMEKLDYRPSSAARALVTGRSRTLGVLTFDTTLYGPAATLLGVERAAHAAGYSVSVFTLEALSRPAVMRGVERLRALGVDGMLVIAPPVAAAGALWDLPGQLPVVAVEAAQQEGLAVVAVDQYQGARLATEHLLELGHTTVHHLAGPQAWVEAEQRMQGWRDALDAVGAKGSAPVRGDWSARSGYELGEQILALSEVTAVFVANDQMALGLLRRLREAGRHVPDDVSIVGFDDVPEAEFFAPPLTTVRQDFGEAGRRSVQLLLQEIAAGRRSSPSTKIPAELIVRSSTSAPH